PHRHARLGCLRLRATNSPTSPTTPSQGMSGFGADFAGGAEDPPSFSTITMARAAGMPQTARVRRAHHPSLPGTINPVCATREHVRRPGHHTPALACAVREHVR